MKNLVILGSTGSIGVSTLEIAAAYPDTAAQGNLRGKTGTTNDVNSLGGYVTAKNGEELVFAFIYNGRSLNGARVTIDRMGVSLAGFTR
jgi:D-alanyl-D-alanine carboxypeptidase/D-alanyl-D-alanine-endopeptidase (penicillin-binding protein 4)